MIARLLLALAAGPHLFAAAWYWDVCYDEMVPAFQCYNLNAPYTNTLFHYPWSPTDQNIIFSLFTANNPTTPDHLAARDAKTVSSSHFNSNGKVAFLIHGFTDSMEGIWVAPLIQELLTKVENVIFVDWENGAKGPDYYRATANTRVVGAQVATLIKTLGVDPAIVHLIGHSLGAHVAGYAGEKFGGTYYEFDDRKIGRITAMDPAAPKFEGYDVRVKLDPTDATFVDVIHSDTESLYKGGLGVKKPCGHVDFFPNGGWDQPGCSPSLIDLSDFSSVMSITETVACSHSRAIAYFNASINEHDFEGHPCSGLEDYLDGYCERCGTSGCNHMGYAASPLKPGSFFLHTDSLYPF
ncbi:pancreatic lipase-related protein 2-like [Littorina saxatilis]|uniref:Lipase domain-containing protein n=1 Tax=Littorina saxatilis TaxID=31220 RepID=A0AAN9GQ88_9CAEN